MAWVAYQQVASHAATMPFKRRDDQAQTLVQFRSPISTDHERRVQRGHGWLPKEANRYLDCLAVHDAMHIRLANECVFSEAAVASKCNRHTTTSQDRNSITDTQSGGPQALQDTFIMRANLKEASIPDSPLHSLEIPPDQLGRFFGEHVYGIEVTVAGFLLRTLHKRSSEFGRCRIPMFIPISYKGPPKRVFSVATSYESMLELPRKAVATSA